MLVYSLVLQSLKALALVWKPWLLVAFNVTANRSFLDLFSGFAEFVDFRDPYKCRVFQLTFEDERERISKPSSVWFS